ncbi:MAG: UTP--glucose-1-phosphate uridylyltransferase [Pirellulaceae bacterium]|nr:UTP--glucose-1-phosphate uridylyltransferase [Pirellulaceae bacterium]
MNVPAHPKAPISVENIWIDTIVSDDEAVRNRSLESLCAGIDANGLLAVADRLDTFRKESDNLYHRVRAQFYLAAIYRFFLPKVFCETQTGLLEFDAYQHILHRRFNEAIDVLLVAQANDGPTLAVTSALAKAYHQIGFQTLADQVRRSVRTVRGNQWMFRIGHPSDHPLRLHKRLMEVDPHHRSFPILVERTSVRMDFSHSGWSDIFFLGMDYPEGARVVNAAINLGVYGRDEAPRPPVEAYLRVIDRPVLRLVSVDLGAEAELTEIDDIFDFAKDYLGLLKAALIASGVVPPAMEGCHRKVSELLKTLTGRADLGLEVVSQVNDIPKGSRLAVSTNLLGSLISVLMRATGQVEQLEGGLSEPERRLVTARAILGEWLGGSGGGWQDSGGIWPGIKLIHGCPATPDDPEYGISRGRLMPQHVELDLQRVSKESREKLQKSLILVYGGMAQNVGPILEMVTEKYLVRSEKEWEARLEATKILDQIIDALQDGDIRKVGELTTRNFFGPLQTIIPWCTNRFTESIIEQCRVRFGEQFWGFWMLGGMSGGGMGFLFDPSIQNIARPWLLETLVATKRAMQTRLPFAMDPVVYDFEINDRGTWSTLLTGEQAVLADGYYSIVTPKWLKRDMRELSPQTQRELLQLSSKIRLGNTSSSWLLDRILPQPPKTAEAVSNLKELLQSNGFDREQHEQIRNDLLTGRLGLSQNRLPSQTSISDVELDDVIDLRLANDSDDLKRSVDSQSSPNASSLGYSALVDGRVAVVTLAAGVGSRWTGGAGVVKGLYPFCKFNGRHRSFIELHLAKSRKISERYRTLIPHVFTTGYMTHEPMAKHLDEANRYDYPGPVYLSPGKSVGLRTVPTARDLQFFWEETSHQILDEQQQKIRAGLHIALMNWATTVGEASDYTDNVPMQCMHPVGHWYEIPNMLRNGLLHQMLSEHPQLQYLMLHNIDTLGATVNPKMLGQHIQSGSCLSFEVIGRRADDRGGGLARVDGKLRLVEGLALPREEEEFKLSFYNTLTTWIDIDQLLSLFKLKRSDLEDTELVDAGIRKLAYRLPTYITIKDVKKRWGQAQEDVFPVAQFEKLWGDMSTLPEIRCEYFAVSTMRGQQLKDPAELDGWVRDGSAAYVNSLCSW